MKKEFKKLVGIALSAILVIGNVYFTSAQNLKKFEKKGKYGFQDESGNIVIPAKFKSAEEFTEGLAAVKLKDKWGFIDETGKEIIGFNYVEVKPFSEGKAMAKYSYLEKAGFIDKNGISVLPFEFSSPSSFHNGYASEVAMVDYEMKYGFIDIFGSMQVEPCYEYAAYEGDIWKVKQNGKIGYLDINLKMIVPCEIVGSTGFINDIAVVNIGGTMENYIITGGKNGYLDKKGNYLTPVQFDKAEVFEKDGTAKVTLNGEQYYINTKGERVNK